jgi:hypothetical protein
MVFGDTPTIECEERRDGFGGELRPLNSGACSYELREEPLEYDDGLNELLEKQLPGVAEKSSS